MTDLELTDDQRRKLARRADRWRRYGLTACTAALVLLCAAIWLADWRFAATAALLAPPAAWWLLLSGWAENPKHQREIAARAARRSAR